MSTPANGGHASPPVCRCTYRTFGRERSTAASAGCRLRSTGAMTAAMSRGSLSGVLGTWLVFACSAVAAQDAARVSLRSAADCEAAGAGFEARVTAALVGAPARERTAKVTIERRGARYRT